MANVSSWFPPLKIPYGSVPHEFTFKKNKTKQPTSKPSADTICLNNLGQQITEAYYLLCKKATPCF